MALSEELENLIKSMDLDQGNGGFAADKPGKDMLKGEEGMDVIGNNGAGVVDKGEKKDDEEEEEEEGMDKSLNGRLRADDTMAKSLDAAPILDELIAGIDDLADDMRKGMSDMNASQGVVNEALVKGLSKSLQLLNEQGLIIKGLSEQLVALGAKPAPRRAAQPGVQVLEKGMGGAPAVTQDQGMSRLIIQDKLIKGIKAGTVQPEYAQSFDKGFALPEHVFEQIKAL